MGQFHDEMPDWLVEWLLEQHLFFVATAPLAGDGHINLSPKGARAKESRWLRRSNVHESTVDLVRFSSARNIPRYRLKDGVV